MKAWLTVLFLLLAAPAFAIGVDEAPLDDPTLARWLILCCLWGRGADAAQLSRGASRLDAARLGDPTAIAKAGPHAVLQALQGVAPPRPTGVGSAWWPRANDFLCPAPPPRRMGCLHWRHR